jgi:hypothetical protein
MPSSGKRHHCQDCQVCDAECCSYRFYYYTTRFIQPATIPSPKRPKRKKKKKPKLLHQDHALPQAMLVKCCAPLLYSPDLVRPFKHGAPDVP